MTPVEFKKMSCQLLGSRALVIPGAEVVKILKLKRFFVFLGGGGFPTF